MVNFVSSSAEGRPSSKISTHSGFSDILPRNKGKGLAPLETGTPIQHMVPALRTNQEKWVLSGFEQYFGNDCSIKVGPHLPPTITLRCCYKLNRESHYPGPAREGLSPGNLLSRKIPQYSSPEFGPDRLHSSVSIGIKKCSALQHAVAIISF